MKLKLIIVFSFCERINWVQIGEYVRVESIVKGVIFGFVKLIEGNSKLDMICWCSFKSPWGGCFINFSHFMMKTKMEQEREEDKKNFFFVVLPIKNVI